MKKMRRTKRLVIGILVSIMMTLQLCNVTWANVSVPVTEDISNAIANEPMDIPSQVMNSGNYMEIPVYYEEGNKNSTTPVEAVTVYLEKKGGTDKSKGYATFRVKGYAYRNGTNITLGILYGYYNKNGEWTQHFLDQAGIVNIDGKYQGNDWKNDKNWAGWQKEKYFTRVEGFKFTDGQENHSGTRVRFLTNTSLDNGLFKDRDSNDVLLTPFPYNPSSNGAFTVVRTIEELTNEKNVWKVTVKVTATQKAEIKSKKTDVVLLIDRSSSMNNNNRISIVKESSKKMIDSLTQIDNTDVAVVAFGGKGTNTTEKCKDFTNSASDLKKGIDKALGSTAQGTPLANGFEVANDLLQKRTAENKIIVLLSDGAPSVAYDSYHVEENADAKDSSTAYANKAKKANVSIYTVAAGNEISKYGKETLAECASSDAMALVAGDNEEELTNKLKEISQKISKSVIGSVSLKESLDNGHFKLNLPLNEDKTNIKKVASEAEINSINWKEDCAAMTQGTLKELSNGNVEWALGEVDPTKPAILAYCVEMTQGILDTKYDIYSNTKITYYDENNNEKHQALENIKTKASWAKIKVYWRYKNADSNPNANALLIPPKDVWYKVPADYDATKGFDFNANTTPINLSTMEVVPEGTVDSNARVANSIVDPTITAPQPTGTPTGAPTGTPTDAPAENNKIEISSETKNYDKTPVIYESIVNEGIIPLVGGDYNYIQPEGLANIAYKIVIDKAAVIQMKCYIDLDDALNAKVNGKKAFNWTLGADQLSIEITNANTNAKLVKGTDYQVSIVDSTKICITFRDSDIYYIGDTLNVKIYSKVGLGTGVKYFGSADSYTSTLNGKTVDIDTILETVNQVNVNETSGEIIWDTGAKQASKKITMRYTELPQVH